ncbi:Calx-beta domain-containing protein [Bacteroidota bacterium]
MWLRTDDLGLSNNDSVTTWIDTSGNSNNVIAAANEKPLFKSGVINGLPVVRFNGINSFMTGGSILSGNTGRTIFILSRMNLTGGTYNGLIMSLDHPNGGAGSGTAFSITPEVALRVSGNKVFNEGFVQDNFELLTLRLPDGANVTQTEMFLDGITGTESSNSSASINTGANGISLGYSDHITEYYNGDISEIIVYNTELNNAQRIIVENYIAAKYDLSIANDLFDYEGIHGKDVAGIGRTDADSLHTIAQSAGMVTIGNASDLDDDEFVLFGHDGGSIASWTSTDVPSSDVNVKRIAREWRIDETGDLGTITISLDTSQLPVKPAGYTVYALLVDNNGTFASGASVYALELDNGEYKVDMVNIASGNYLTFAVIRPVIEFITLSSEGNENDSPALIEAGINYPLPSNSSVQYAVSGGTATGGGTDFTLSPGTLIIPADSGSASIQISLINDTDVESSETIEIDLSNPSDGITLGDDSIHTFSINDDDNPRKIEFASTNSGGNENDTTIQIYVQINTVDNSNNTTAAYTVTGTATGNGIDYTLTDDTVTVFAGSLTDSIALVITEDLIDEIDETVIITLSSPTNSNLGTNTQFTYTISDNDNQPEIEFTDSVSSNSEGASPALVYVGLSSVSAQTVTVDYSVTGGTAVGSGGDYTLANGTLTFNPGEDSSSISIILINDDSIETEETITLVISNPSNGSLGTQQSHTFTIKDNDNDGFTGPAGVGDANNNTLWIRAHDLGLANGATVSSWSDTSGNNNDFGAGVGGPLFATSEVNGHPSVVFDGNDELEAPSTVTGNAGRTIFLVGKVDASIANSGFIELNSGRSGGSGESYLIRGEVAVRVSGNRVYNESFGTTNYRLLTVRNAAGSNVTQTEAYLEGTALTEASSSSAVINTATGGTALGGYGGGSNAELEGKIAEIIIYTTKLNESQRIIIENYLAAKYNFTIANDKFGYDANNGYDVAGIGQASASNLHTTAQSAGIVKVSNASSLNDNDYLLFGHDSGSISSWVTADDPNGGTNSKRLEREWRFDENNEVGTITIGIDTSLLPVKTAEYTKYVIWIDNDGTFATGATQYPLDLNGDYYEASGINLTDGQYLAIGIIRPEMQFSSGTSGEDEYITPAQVYVELNYTLSHDVIANYTVTGGSASGSGTDYTLANGSVTVSAGTTLDSISIVLVNDKLIEGNETIDLSLSVQTAGIQEGTTAHTFTITDDESTRQIQFEKTDSAHNESISPISLTIEVNNVDNYNPTTVNYSVTGGTATGSGTDYTLNNGTATIIAGNASTTINIVINDDAIDEVNETIEITLSGATNASLGANSVFTDTIQDNDASSVQFSDTLSFAAEDIDSAWVIIELSTPQGSDVNVDYNVTGGTATGGGTDYTLANGTFTIPADSLSDTLKIEIIDDSDIETDESIRISLSNPTVVSLGTDSVHTVIINDNDFEGYKGPAGVGDTSNNLLWLGADFIDGLSNNDPVPTWTDTSGKNNDAIQLTSTNQPTYKTNRVNGYPAVYFDDTDDYYENVFQITSQNLTIFTVFSLPAATDGPIWQTRKNNQSGFFPHYTDNNQYIDRGAAWIFKASEFNTSTWYIASAVYGTGSTELFKNGTLNDNFAANAIVVDSLQLGARLTNNNYFGGDIAEFIFYKNDLNDAQRTIVENYLSTKYDISISNDKYAYDAGHPYELAGIGREDASNFHTVAQSTGLIRVRGASSLDDGDYLLFGHDNASISTWNTNDVPVSDSTILRVDREWRFDETGNIGTVTVGIDTNLLPTRPEGYKTYIWIDEDGTFASNATEYPLTLVNGYFEASGVEINDGNYLTIGIFRPVIQLTDTVSSGFEPASPINIEVSLNYVVNEDVSVQYEVTGGSATGSGTDYTLVDGTATISAGFTTTNIVLNVVNDIDVESDETITLRLFNPSSGVELGGDSTYTYTIHDDDNPRTVEFTLTGKTNAENVTLVTVFIQTSSIDIVNDLTVQYAVSNGTATGGGIDYTLTNGTATILAGDPNTSFNFNVIDDVIDENDETIIIELSNPTDANLGTNTTYTYTITDNDAIPTIEFTQTSSGSDEGTSPASLEVSLSAASGLDITVDYAVSGGTASSGTDFSLSDGTLTVTAGNTSANVSPTIFDDGIVELDETIEVTISNESNATMGGNTVHTFTIHDNDFTGFVGPGGVGASNSVKLWLGADLLSGLNNGDNIQTWPDTSGNDNDAIQLTGANQPTYQTNVLNGKPVVRFNGDDFYENILTIASQNMTIYTVFYHDFTATFDGPLWQTENVNGSGFFPRYSNNQQYIHYGANWLTKGSEFTNNTWYSSIGLYQTGRTELWKDGVLNDSQNSNTVGLGDFRIGYRESTGEYFRGDVAELIFFNYDLNDAQRIIVENYLAAKYDLSITNDKFQFEANHGKHVAGIGLEDASNFHTAAKSADIFKISNATALDAGDYLLFGHDASGISSWTTTDAPNSGVNVKRIAREWRVDETGETGTLTLSLDTTLLPAKPAGYTHYVAYVDTNGTFANGATQYPMSLNDSTYYVDGVDLETGNYITFAIVRPVIRFTDTASSTSEGDGSLQVEISLNIALSEDVDVDYTVTGGDATGGGTDYTLADGTATITAGNTTTNITITLNDDGTEETDETIDIQLSNPSSGVNLGTYTDHTVTINDNDNPRKIQFSVDSAGNAENITLKTVFISINTVNPGGVTTVDYAVTGGTATGGGVDYTLVNGTASIPANQTFTSFDFTIINDLLDENDEYLIVTLSNPNSSSIGTNSTYKYTIVDNDSEPTVSFTTTSSNGDEATSPAYLEVSLSALSGLDISVDFAINGGTATDDADYAIEEGTLTISAGSSSDSIETIIYDDGLVEVDETIEIDLSNASSNAILGDDSIHTYTINDDDIEGFTGPGGVGGNSSLLLWLRADYITGIDSGDNVPTWVDTSGNNNDAIQSTGINQPSYHTNIVNGKPVVRFDDGDDFYEDVFVVPAQNMTIYTVFNLPAGTDGPLWQTDQVNQSGFFPRYADNIQYFDRGGAWLSKASEFNTSTWYIASGLYGTGSSQLFKDGTLNDSYAGNTITIDNFQIGARLSNNNYYGGDIAEIIYYNYDLDDAKRILVDNYLAAKYGITISTDKYAYESAHGEDVAGIGREDSDNFHVASKSAGILKIGSASSLGDGDYMLYGHDGANISSWTNSELQGTDTNIRRLTREWRFDETGDIGTLTLSIDTALLPAKPSGYTEYTLWLDSDGDFTSGASQYPLTLNSGLYKATGVNITDGNYLMISCFKPVIQFTDTISDGFENESPVDFVVELNFALNRNVSVDYNVSGTAQGGGTDFTLANGMKTITAGDTSATISATINDESDEENDETIIVTLSNPTANVNLGADSVHTYTLHDNDHTRNIQFTGTSANGAESTTLKTVFIELSSANPVQATSVDYTVTSGTATGGGTDYTLANGTATITATNTTTSFNITIINDAIDEQNETIIITLSNPINASLGANTQFTYTINDNDDIPTVQFASTASNGDESVSPANIPVSLSAVSGLDVTVDYQVTGGGTATSASDYSLASGTLTIPAGSASSNIVMTIFDDGKVEVDETVIIDLSNASATATLGDDSVHTYTINDNDVEGFSGPGGIGGSSQNLLWLRADYINGLNDSDFVQTWIDTSGNNNDAAQLIAGSRPMYRQNVVNGEPVVTFDDTDDYYESVFEIASQNLSVFVVFNMPVSTDGPIWQTAKQDVSGFFPRFTNNIQYIDRGNVWKSKASDFGTTTWHIANAVYGTGSTELYKNGSLSDSYAGNAITIDSLQLARRINTNGYFGGDIAEFIFYNYALNDAQRIIVDNYLSAKYGISITNDKYSYQTNYGQDVAGIGREDASNFHTAGQSSRILSISNASSLDDGDYLLFGHNSGSIASWTSTDVPDSDTNVRRIAREWRFDETGNVGTITISIDTSALPVKSSGHSAYSLWLDSDGDFTSGAAQYELSLNNGEYEATLVEISDGDFIMVSTIRSEVEFAVTASNDEESNTSVEVSVYLNYQLDHDVTVDYTVTGGTATGGGTDYTLADGTLTISAGEDSGTISITVINDSDIENDETIIIELSNPSSNVYLGTNTEHTYTINDNDADYDIEFTASSASGQESTTLKTVFLSLSGSSPTETKVAYTVTGGTATGNGTDYTVVNDTATIPGGQTSTSFNITIVNDVLDENDETIIITLSGPVNANLGNNKTFTYTILDNDPKPTVEFFAASSNGPEETTPANIVVSLSAVSGLDVSIDYDITGGDALEGTDFALTDSMVTIPAGSASENISITIYDDGIIEMDETIRLTLSNASSTSTIGNDTVHIYTINDNDITGIKGPGGVGADNSILLWLEADKISGLSDGDGVQTWIDTSGNNNDAIQSSSSNQPSYEINEINGLPIVRFDDTDDYFENIFKISSQNMTIFTVFGIPAPTDGPIWQTRQADQSGFFPSYSAPNNQYLDYGAWLSKPTEFYNDTFYLANAVYGTGSTELYKNGTLNDNIASNSVVIDSLQIGARLSNNDYFGGDIAEFIFYNYDLNDAERIIVNNYLSSKYDLSIANDKYSFDSMYGNDVAGIGREDASNIHAAAFSSNLLKVSNSSSLSDGDYLLFGHDNNSYNSWSSTDVPQNETYARRINREWRFDKTNDIGTVLISIDTTNLADKPSGYTQYAIWVDDDGVFANGADLYTTSLESGLYVTTNVTLNDSDYVTIGTYRPVIEFASTTSSSNEGDGSDTITVNLNLPVKFDVTIDYTVTGGSATGSGTDYTLADGTATIFADDTSANIIVNLTDDGDTENAETIEITIGNPTDGITLGSNSIHTHTILDNDQARYIEFTSTSLSNAENVLLVTVFVEVDPVDVGDSTTAELSTSGTATNGIDYTLSNDTVQVDAGQAQGSFDITIVNDNIDEFDETIIIELTNPDNAGIGADNTFTYTITDNDNPPVLQFTTTSSNGSEETTPAEIEVTINPVSGKSVSVDYSVIGGTATGNGEDYILADGTLNIPAGNSTGNVEITIVDDGTVEVDEAIQIDLSSPSNATLGDDTLHTFIINDNDFPLFTGPGGVGDSTTNLLWLRADDLSLTDDDPVSTWIDTSGNDNDATQTLTFRPAFKENIVNDLPVLRFDGINDNFNTVFGITKQNMTIFTVFNHDHQASDTYGPIWATTTGNASGFLPSYSGTQYFNTDNTYKTKVSDFFKNNWYISVGQHGTGSSKIWKNGVLSDSEAVNSIGIGNYQIGWRTDGVYYKGDMAEMIFYNYSLNDAQRILVDNYLASKYNIAITNDYYAYEGTHGNDVAGIGREDNTNFHTAGQSSKIITFSNATSLDSGDFVLFGHNDSSITAWTTTEVPTVSGSQRLAREWRVDLTWDPGFVKVTVDTTILPARPDNSYNYALLVDSDGDFSDCDSVYPLTDVVNNNYSYENVQVNDGNYIAIAIVRNIAINTGSYDSASTWLTGLVPGANEHIVIQAGVTVHLEQNVSVGSIEIENTAAFECRSYNLTISVGTIVNNGTFTPETGTVTYSDNNDQAIAALTYNNLVIGGLGTNELQGNIDVNGNLTINSTLDASANDYSITLAGNWTNNGTFNAQEGEVRLDGSADQNISKDASDEDFYRLTIENSNDILVETDIIISDSLIMNGGDINLNYNLANILTIGTDGTNVGGLNRTSGLIYGIHKKWMNASTLTYSFPIGYNNFYRPLSVTFTSVSNPGKLIGEFYNFPPGTDGLPLIESAYEMNNTYSEGYWKISQEGGFSGSNYNVEIIANGFNSLGSLDSATRLLTRPNTSSDWVLTGTHADAKNDTLKRNSINILPANFTASPASTDCSPTVSDIAGDDTVCANETGVDYQVDDHQLSSYTWQFAQGYGSITQDNGNQITVSWGAASGNDTLIVTEDNGCGTDVDSLPVVILPLPTVNAGIDKSVCVNDTVGIGGSPTASGSTSPYFYLWTPFTYVDDSSLANPNISPQVSGQITYNVSVTDFYGCIDSNNIVVTFDSLPDPNPTATPSILTYGSGSVQLDANPAVGLNYTWSPDSLGGNVNVRNPVYTPSKNPMVISWDFTMYLDVTDGNSCSASDSVDIKVFRKPETGNLYYIPNTFDQ